jgi:hypothetical protein
MEALAFVEELGRHGDVVRRHVIVRLPARIGRGYDMDVIVNDPYVAATHLEIRDAGDGGLEAVDLCSLNGTSRVGDATRISATRIQGDDVFRVGHTQLRVRLPGHAVSPEIPLQARAWDRHPGAFAGSVALLTGIVAWSGFVVTYDTDQSGIFSLSVLVSLLVLSWAAVWSLVGRTCHGNGNFWAHGIVAFLGCAVILIVDALTGYLDFSLDLHGFDLVWTFCAAIVLAGMLYRHLRLTVRMSPRSVGILSIVVALGLLGGMEGYQVVRDANKPGLQSYDKGVKPSIFLFAKGITPDQFGDAAAKLKAKVDKELGVIVR